MLQNLLEQLRNAGTGSKAIAAIVLVAVVAVAATAAVVARRPHFELLYSDLSANDSAQVQKALAGAGIPFEQSQPPGPFMIYVDGGDRYRAMHAVATAGALERSPGGILPESGGMSSVFMGADERAQATLKRQWQEMEHLLEVLDFVAEATVTTTPGRTSAFGHGAPRTGSVMLQLRGTEEISRRQAQTIANLVRFGLGIEPRYLNIADQTGASVFDGSEVDEAGNAAQWLEQKAQFEKDLEQRANQVLAAVLGPGAAYVTVNSTWNQDLNTTVSETADPKAKIVVSEYKDSTKTPQGTRPPVGGPAGPGSNAGFGVDNAAVPVETEPAPLAEAKTENSRKEYWTPTETRRTVRVAPVLERLSVSLFLDKNLLDSSDDLGARQAELENSVKAAVGFDTARADAFSSVILPFYTPPVAEGGTEGEGGAAEPSSGPNPMVEMLLERGVEIVSALAFLFLLSRALKGSKPKPAEEKKDTRSKGDPDDMMELLAQAQIEELVKSDPERVGQILSSWAAEEKAGAA